MSGRPGRRVRRVVLVAVLAAVGAACGVPTDESMRPIRPADVPFGLGDEAAAASSTVEPPPTSAPNPTIPVPVQESTSTVAQERVLLYFATESNLVEVRVQLPVPVTLARLLEALTVRPELAGSPNLRTVLGPEDVQSVTTLGGVATVDLGSRFSELPVAEQRLAVAQMVLTLTSQAGVGQVRFTVAGQEADVPRADGSIARSAVSRDDYATLLR